MTKVSFVVINRNNEFHINKCLSAIHKIDYSDKEVILVDDCSTDQSLQKLKIKPDRIIKNRHQNGIASSRNKGIRKAGGEIVFVIDSDIEIVRLDVFEIITHFEENSKLVAVSGRYLSESSAGDWNRVFDARREKMFYKGEQTYFYGLDLRYTTFSGGFCALHKERIGRVKQRGVMGVASEDLLFQLFLLNNGYQFGYVAEMVGVHHHIREVKGAFRKAKSEAHGNAWLVATALAQGLKIPVLDSVYTFPVFLLAGIILRSPLLILVELFPYVLLIIVYRRLVFFRLILYETYAYLLKIYYFLVLVLFSNKINSSVKLGWFLRAPYLSLVGKYRWLARFASGRRSSE